MEKKWFVKEKVDDCKFIEICKNAISMAEAACQLKIHFNSFKKRALELKCYHPNQGMKGRKRKKINGVIPLDEILNGKYPFYQTFKLKKRLIKEGIKKNQCEYCRIESWQEKKINMELHHIDGDRTNHRKENIKMICPNCHAQTSTYRSKNHKEH